MEKFCDFCNLFFFNQQFLFRSKFGWRHDLPFRHFKNVLYATISNIVSSRGTTCRKKWRKVKFACLVQHGNSSSEFIVLSWLGNALQSGHVITKNMVLQRAKNDWGLRPTTICYLLPIHQLMYLSSTNVQWMLMP